VLHALLAEFNSPGELRDAAGKVRDAGFKRFDAHSPFPIHGIDSAMGIRRSMLPIVIFCGGLTGCLTGLFLQWWTNASDAGVFQWALDLVTHWFQAFLGYQYLISGKPYFSLPANIPVIFELTILFSAITAVLAMLMSNNLPLFYNPLFNSRRFRRATDDGYFISVLATDPKFDAARVRELLTGAGGDVEDVFELPSAARFPKVIHRVGLTVTMLALVPLAVILMARYGKSPDPRIHIIQDMDNQPKFRAQHADLAFSDGRAMRGPVGLSADHPLGLTVARGELHEDSLYNTGLVGKVFAETIPFYRPELTADEHFVRRGQQRFNIYCAPCHGRDGAGAGMVNEHALTIGGGWVQAADLADDERRSRPVGYIFHTITNGIRTMPAYGDQIPVADRWAIVAYVRALQRARHASAADLNPDDLANLRNR